MNSYEKLSIALRVGILECTAKILEEALKDERTKALPKNVVLEFENAAELKCKELKEAKKLLPPILNKQNEEES